MSYGAWLKQHRTRLDLSQEALGELVGVSGTYINKIENRKVKMPYPPLRSRIHAVFGTTDSDPDLLPLLTRQDQDRALTVDRHSVRSPGQRLDQLLAVVTPEQRRNIETILSALDRLVLERSDDVTIAHDSQGDNT